MLQKITEHLTKSSSVAIFVHINPDWDCIGSAFALRNSLRAVDVKSDIFTDAPLSHHLSFMENDVIPYTQGAPAPEYACYCALDVGAVDRMGEWGAFFAKKDDTVCIDHHYQTAPVARLNYVQPQRSATGELVFELISLGGLALTKEIASYLYCAISSDTGSFQYASVNRRTYEILIELADTGINTSYLCSMLYERNTLTQLRLKAETINSIRLYNDGKIAVAALSNETLSKHGATSSDTEALAQIPRSLDGVMISAFLKEHVKRTVRVSLRALGDYNIEPVARSFGGGGHKKAAGCTFRDISITEAEKALVAELAKLF